MGDQLGIKVNILMRKGHMISKKKIADAFKKFIGQISGDGVYLLWLIQYQLEPMAGQIPLHD